MKKILFCCAILAILLGCQAQTYVTVSGEAYFDKTLGGYNNEVGCRPSTELSWGIYQRTCRAYYFPVPPRSQMRWGVTAGSGVSGLGFEAITNQQVLINTDFYIGQLYHFNFPIYDPSTGTTLNIQFTIRNSTNTGLIGVIVYEFPMAIDETVNEEPCIYPGSVECSDKIFFTNAFNPNKTFTLGDVSYTIKLQGFKESASSSSSPLNYFISDEQTVNSAYLFARIEAACPSNCVNGGIYYLLNNGNCACNCSASTCPAGQINTPNCGCTCPDLNFCNHGNGGTLQSNCTCRCNNCTSPKVLNTATNDCSCVCPPNYCGAGSINNTNTCSCNCPVGCQRQNEIRNAQCGCYCPLASQCVYPRVEDPNPNVCACICDPNMVCPNAGETVNSTTCACQCTKTCPNGQILDVPTCSCGPCVGEWTQDGNGLCTVCPLTNATCAVLNMTLNAGVCKCVCDNLVCDIDIGKVVDTTQNCSCRNCRAGECRCGNGIVEPGEDCDTGPVSDPCCSQCRFTFASCDDNNACTSNDACQNGECSGNYQCGVPTDCANITCDLNLGCITIPYDNGLPCGPVPRNLCNQQCVGGVCSNVVITCPADTNPIDCMAPQCNPATGTCSDYPTSGNSCIDGNACTSNDTCVNGTCNGAPITCIQSGLKCAVNACDPNIGRCLPSNFPDSTPCDADNNLCTKGDYCLGGSCNIGNLTVCTPPTNDSCKMSVCDISTGNCLNQAVENNRTCNDLNFCTTNDTCVDGNCQGVQDPTLANTEQCGAVLPPTTATATAAIAFSVAGAVAAIGAIVGMAFLIKKIRNSRIDDPDTWSPDTFHTVGSNPLYKGNESVVDNRMYEGTRA